MKITFKFIPSYHNDNNFIPTSSIYFMHIPKCGGTTIDHIFGRLSLILQNFEFQRHTYKSINNKKFFYSNNLLKKTTYISGHLDYNFTKNIKNIFRFSIVRDPIERVISQYKFITFKRKITPLQYTFEQFLEQEIDANRDNLATRHFAGLLNEQKIINSSDKELAIKNLDNFDSINIMDNWDNFVSDILTKFHLPSIIYSRFQEHDYNFKYKTTLKNIEHIQKFYAYDLEIYKLIKKNINNKTLKKNNTYNKKICIVSPFVKAENKLYDESEIEKFLNKID